MRASGIPAARLIPIQRHPALYRQVGKFSVNNRTHHQLKEAIQSAHQQSINRGISISLNAVPLTAPIAKLRQSGEIKPANRTVTLDEETDAPITVKLFAGIADSEPEEAGWNIFCNGRLVLEADGTITTGWGEGNGRTIPRYHNQFARFRGYAFFDCDDASKLPWNTTKTGVDADTEIYQAIRQQMIQLMRPVIDFLNRLDAEVRRESDEQPLTNAVDESRRIKLENLPPSDLFTALVDEPPPVPKPIKRRIQYDKLESEIKEVKESLGVTTFREVGEETFNYYYRLECE